MIYYIVYFLTKLTSLFFFPRKITGHAHIPETGGFIIASNHISNLDPVVLGISSKRRINFMAKSELFQNKLLGFVLPKLGAFPIKRGAADLGALKEAIGRLKKGKPVLMFVEGTRRIGNAKPVAQPGVGFIAVKANVPVIPVYIKGTERVMPPGAKGLTRHRVHVTFGAPIPLDLTQSHEEIAQKILEGIYALQ